MPYIDFQDIPVLQCCDCYFIYSGKLMRGDALDAYYQKGFGSKRHEQGQSINAKINAWAIQKLLPSKMIQNHLDVGAGYGFLVKEMCSQFGIDAVGVEVSQQEATYGKNHLGLDIRNCTLSESGLPMGSYDLVTSFEVIEHIPDPSAFIDEMLTYVKPGGYLLVMTDNFESETVRALGPAFPKWIPHSHISHFGSSTLEELLLKRRVDIIGRLSYTPWELLARRYFYKLIGYKPLPDECFDLDRVLGSEMSSVYKFFSLRKVVNVIWAKITAEPSLNGALMFLAVKRSD